MTPPGKVGHCDKCGDWRLIIDGKGRCFKCAEPEPNKGAGPALPGPNDHITEGFTFDGEASNEDNRT